MIAGKDFKIEDDDKILQISSPHNRLEGPYVVIIKNTIKRWAIVALRWDDYNGLGIRWFNNKAGCPFNRQSTWFIIPEELHSGVIRLLKKEINKKALASFLKDKKTDSYTLLQQTFETEII